jgi:hypothetical protein
MSATRSRLKSLQRLAAVRLAGDDPAAAKVERYRADPTALMADAGFSPDPWQREFLSSRDRMNLLLCARQVGKSLAVSLLALHAALTRPESLTVIVAQRQDQAAEMLRKSVTAYYRVGAPVPMKRQGATHFELETGARLLALPGEERAMHGPTADLLIIDEASRVPDEVYHAASPQLSASGGRLVALSTAFTRSGWFYKEWTEGEGWRRWSITARECPRHSPEFLARERRSMGDRWFAMAYLNQFGDDVAAVFATEDIRAARSADVKPLFAAPDHRPADVSSDARPKPLFAGVRR